MPDNKHLSQQLAAISQKITDVGDELKQFKTAMETSFATVRLDVAQNLEKIEKFEGQIATMEGKIGTLMETKDHVDAMVDDDVMRKINCIEESNLAGFLDDNPGILERFKTMANENIEQRLKVLEEAAKRKRPFLYDRTIVCMKIPLKDGEKEPSTAEATRREVAETLVYEGLGLSRDVVRIVATARLPKPADAKWIPGLKIEFESEEIKIMALKAKQGLRLKEGTIVDRPFKEIYIRSSQSHFERAVIKNFSVFLHHSGAPFYIAGNGCIFHNSGQKVDLYGQPAGSSRDARQDRPQFGDRGGRGGSRGRGYGHARGAYTNAGSQFY
jgi:hypothetical protein